MMKTHVLSRQAAAEDTLRAFISRWRVFHKKVSVAGKRETQIVSPHKSSSLLSCLKPMHFTCSQHQADFNNTHDSGGQNISRSQAQHASHEFNSASLMHATSTESKQHAYDDLHPTDEFSTTMDGWCSDGVVRRDRVAMMVAVSPEYARLAKKATTTTTTTVTNERTNERKNGRTTERTQW